MKIHFSLKPVFAASVSLFALSCTSFEGNYAAPNKVEIVDDRWNETDARVIGEKMIKSALAKRWLPDWNAEHKGKKPFLLVDDMENRTSEQIDTKALFEAVRNELMNSGRVRFLDGAQRDKILKEYRYQQSGVVRADQAKGPGKQFGADLYLVGAVSSQVAQQGGYKTVTYQVEMRLTNIETSEIVWTEVEKLKKQFRRSGSSF
jgi:penicillin-binding protein activator